MKPAPFDYFAASSVEEALGLLEEYGEGARLLAGGQSLVPMMAFRLARPTKLIDLNPIASIAGIKLGKGHLRIGPMTRQAELLASPLVSRHAPLLTRALKHVGHPATRCRGTIGGSLAHADPAAELPVAMVALEARLTLQSRSGRQRTLKAGEFFKDAFETALEHGELITEVEVPFTAGGSAFLEVSPRKGDFAVLAAAAHLKVDADGQCSCCTLVLGGVASKPLRCTEVESQVVGRYVDESAIARAIEAIPTDEIETEDRHASRAYRRRVAPVIARRVLTLAFDISGRGSHE
jgi:CO/xanthine dehydrogenase FAD-binding subunit